MAVLVLKVYGASIFLLNQTLRSHWRIQVEFLIKPLIIRFSLNIWLVDSSYVQILLLRVNIETRKGNIVKVLVVRDGPRHLNFLVTPSGGFLSYSTTFHAQPIFMIQLWRLAETARALMVVNDRLWHIKVPITIFQEFKIFLFSTAIRANIQSTFHGCFDWAINSWRLTKYIIFWSLN